MLGDVYSPVVRNKLVSDRNVQKYRDFHET